MLRIYNIDLLRIIIDYLPVSETVHFISELKILNHETINIVKEKYKLQKDNWKNILMEKGIMLEVEKWDMEMFDFYNNSSFLELVHEQLSNITKYVSVVNNKCTASLINKKCPKKYKFYTKSGPKCNLHYKENVNLLFYLECILFDYKNLFNVLSGKILL